MQLDLSPSISFTSIVEDPFKEDDLNQTELANIIPMLPLRGMVAFPNGSMPVQIGRESSLKAVEYCLKHKSPILLISQLDPETEEPGKGDLFNVGVVGRVLKLIELPDGAKTALVVTQGRANLDKVVKKKPFLLGKVSQRPDIFPTTEDIEFITALATAKDYMYNILDVVGHDETAELRFGVEHIENPYIQLDFMIGNSPVPLDVKQHLLAVDIVKQRCMEFVKELGTALQIMKIRQDIQERTSRELSDQQKEHFLRQQIHSIQEELGDISDIDEINELTRRSLQKNWDANVQRHFDKEIAKLQRFNPQSQDYPIQYTYLDTLLNLPWDEYSSGKVSLPKIEKTLDRDHYGLEKVKERIIEHMAVLKLRGDLKSPIICLYGPPGVGKTSLGKSIAEALGREYCRVSLGGLHDEAEIRGHRRTYLGALPGRIMSALAKCKTSDPVFLLDEIDKIGSDFKGDPSTALLEVLDPEQNSKFHDNYIDVDYDLSHVLFIATANDLSTISRPLLDRMEVINIEGYITEEKVMIASRHLLPKELEIHGFSPKEVTIKKAALTKMIESYTRESGVRQLDKTIAKLLRKLARLKASGQQFPTSIGLPELSEYLGPEEIVPDALDSEAAVGVVTGLAWTSVGGEILFIESSLAPGKGDKLTLTGNLGDVMKESAVLALQYLKANAGQFGIDPQLFTTKDIHIHVPEGAIPKDGPSAGITIATSLASSLTGRPVARKVAMTGEITLRGKILPVGGIKEKILAAKRFGSEYIFLSEKNRKDIEKIPEKYLKGLKFIFVNEINQVLHIVLNI